MRQCPTEGQASCSPRGAATPAARGQHGWAPRARSTRRPLRTKCLCLLGQTSGQVMGRLRRDRPSARPLRLEPCPPSPPATTISSTRRSASSRRWGRTGGRSSRRSGSWPTATRSGSRSTRRARRPANLRRNPAVGLLILDPRAHVPRPSRSRGDATVDDDPDYVFADRVGAKYGADLRGLTISPVRPGSWSTPRPDPGATPST